MRQILYTFLILACVACSSKSSEHTLLIGTYTIAQSQGIYSSTFDSRTGTLSEPTLVVEAKNPSYLTLSEDGEYLYAVNESGSDSSLGAYRYDNKTRTAELINIQPTLGASPCFVALFGDYAYTANYTGGSLSAFALGEDGSIGEARVLRFIDRADEGVRSHIHGVFPARNGEHIYVTDLGYDRIYRIEPPLHLIDYVSLAAGAGPRHIAQSDGGEYIYSINELDGTVTMFDTTGDELRLVQTIASDSVGGGGSADIHLSDDGRFLYASNRLKEDGISTFEVSKSDGTLQKIDYTLTDPHPRNFTLSPDGEYLLVASRDGNSVEVFRRDKRRGTLTPTGEKIELSMPVCLRWVE